MKSRLPSSQTVMALASRGYLSPPRAPTMAKHCCSFYRQNGKSNRKSFVWIQFIGRSFSVETNGATASLNLSSMSSNELQQLTMEYARQQNPSQAQFTFEQLARRYDESAGDEIMPKNDLISLRTTLVDSWTQYQTTQMSSIRESMSNNVDNLAAKDALENVHHAAVSISKLVNGIVTPSQHHFAASLKAWANVCETAHYTGLMKSNLIRGIPQRVQHLLLLQVGTNSKVSVEEVNQVLRAWAYSSEHLRGTMAEQIFQQYFPPISGAGTLENIVGTNSSPSQTLSPNGESFRYIINAWCFSKERRCAFNATGHFMRMMRVLELGQIDVEPKLSDYHILFKAWTTAEDKNAPSKAQTALQIAENAYKKGITQVRPDIDCYRDALITMSRRVNVTEVGELADETLTAIKKDLMMIPNSECYGAAILAWKNVATARECEDRDRAAQRALELLREMTKAFHRTTTVTVKPTTDHYNHVLEALTMSNSAWAPDQAETLLRDMEASMAQHEMIQEEPLNSALHIETVSEPVPNATSYKHVFSVLGRSKKPSNLTTAMTIFERLKTRMPELKKNSDKKYIVEAYSRFIEVCAYANIKEESRRTRTMTVALKTLEELMENGLEPGSSTYAALLEACNQLLKDGRERQGVLETIFLRACEEGLVNQAVLENFREAASTYLYAKLVVAPSQEMEQMKVVPVTWTRNVTEYMVNSKGGRKVLPLTIEGKFTFTKAAAEFKMRKLRRKANKLMLQGGRMK